MTGRQASIANGCDSRIVKGAQKALRPHSITRTLANILIFLTSTALVACEFNGDSYWEHSEERANSRSESISVLDNLSEDDKKQLFDYSQKTRLFMLLMHMQDAQLHNVCSTGIEKHCSSEKRNVGSCLYLVQDQLTACCSSSVRRSVGKPGIAVEQMHGDVLLPVGSELDFNKSCDSSVVTLHESVSYGDFYLGPGEVIFDERQRVTHADLTHGQNFNGLILAGGAQNRAQFEAFNRISSAMLAENSTYQGYQLREGTSIEFYSSGALQKATLDKPRRFGDFLVEEGVIVFQENGFVPRAKLAVPLTTPSGVIPRNTDVHLDEQTGLQMIYITHEWNIGGLSVPQRIWLEVHPNGQIKHLDTTLQPIAMGGRIYPEYTRLEFAADGLVARDSFRDRTFRPNVSTSNLHPSPIELQQAIKIGVLEFPKHSFVYKRHDGSLRFAISPRTMTYRDIELSASPIRFSHSDLVSEATLAAEKKIDRITLPIGSIINFDNFGNLRSVFSDKRIQIDENWLSKEQSIKIHSNGTLKEYELEENSSVFDLVFHRPVTLELYDTGYISSVFSEDSFELQGIEYDGNSVYFHPNGVVSSGVLHVASTVQGILYAAGTELMFDTGGKRIHSWAGKPRWKNGQPRPFKKHNNSDNLSTTIMVGFEYPKRMPWSPLNEEGCEKMFPGYKEGESKPVAGLSLGQPLTAARLGCGATDEEAGILSRSP